MAKVSIYLHFKGNTEDVFNFYKQVFKTEFVAPVSYMKDVPVDPDQPALSEEDQNKVMHVALPIIGGLQLMGTDMLDSMGTVVFGNNVSINLEPDTRAEAERLFKELSFEGEVEVGLKEMFWGDYYAAFADKYGVHWMINCSSKD